MTINLKKTYSTYLSLQGTKDTTIFVITKLLYICIENIKIIIVYEHKTYIKR